MPQLDFSTFGSQIFWLAVSFSILYMILARFSLPVIREVLQGRQARISGDLKKAEALKEEAESAQADFTSLISEARQKALAMMNEARIKADKSAQVRHAKLEDNFARQAKEAEHRVALIKKEASASLTPVAVEIAGDLVKKLTGIKINSSDVEKIVLKLISEHQKV